jgi:hypothetical protein
MKPLCETWMMDKLCGHEGCRYWIHWIRTGNCVLKMQQEHTLDEIGVAFGFTRQRAEQILEKALRHYRIQHMREIYEGNQVLAQVMRRIGIDTEAMGMVQSEQGRGSRKG